MKSKLFPLLLLAACAHAPDRTPSTLLDLTHAGPQPESLALSARVLEALGRPDEAWTRWLAVGEAPAWRAWALTRLEGLVDWIDLSHAPRLSGWLPDSAPLLAMIEWRLGESPHRDAPIRYRASRRLASWPGDLTTPAGLVGAQMDSVAATPWRQSHDGQLASPRDGAGLYAFELDLAPGRHPLTITTEADLTVWLTPTDGPPRRLAEHPALSRFLPTRLELDVELGAHERLELHAADRSPQIQLTVTRRPQGPTLGTGAPNPRTGDAELFAMADSAMRHGDIAQIARIEAELHRRLERFATSPRDRALVPLWHVELARLALADRSRPRDRQKSDAFAHLEDALNIQPDHLEALALATRLQLEDDPWAARLRLETALASRPHDALPPQILALAIESLLITDERREAFARAHTLAQRLPSSCHLRALYLETGFEDLRYRPLTDRPRLGPPPDPACLDLRWREVALARETFALDRARALLAPLVDPAGLSPGPALGKAHTLLAQIELAAGNPKTALTHLALSKEQGEDAGLLDELTRRATTLDRSPHPAPKLAPLTDLRKTLKRLPKPTANDGGATTLLREIRLHVHADGSLTLLEHVAIRALDKKAIETLGEIAVPHGAEVLAARTWKVQRAPLLPIEPEDLLEKDTISLPALAIGDVAEWAWTYTRPMDPRLAPLWVAPPIYFDSEDGPVELARLVMTVDPQAPQPTFHIEPSQTHTLTTEHLPDQHRWIVTARSVPQAYPEPLTPSPRAHRRMLHVHGGPLDTRLHAALTAEIRHSTRPSPAIDALIGDALGQNPAETPPPLGRPATETLRLRRLYEHLLSAIDEPVEADVIGPGSTDASFIAHRRRGARALVLLSACRALSIRCDLALARPIWDGPPPAYADPQAHTYPLIVHRDSGTWLDPAGRYNPWGVIPPGLTDAPAALYSLSASTQPELIRTPPASAIQLGLRKAQLDIELTDPTTFIAHGEETLDGAYGASWRFVLAPLTHEHRQRVLASVVQQALPGAAIETIELTDLETVDRPLGLRWRARGTTQPAGGKMASLGIALFPESLARSTVHLSARDTPLLVNLAVALDLTVRVIAPPGHGFPTVPRDLVIEQGSLHFQRRSDFKDNGRVVTLTKTMTLTPTIIAPSEYAAWRDAAQAVDRADLIQLVFGPGTPTSEPRK